MSYVLNQFDGSISTANCSFRNQILIPGNVAGYSLGRLCNDFLLPCLRSYSQPMARRHLHIAKQKLACVTLKTKLKLQLCDNYSAHFVTNVGRNLALLGVKTYNLLTSARIGCAKHECIRNKRE